MTVPPATKTIIDRIEAKTDMLRRSPAGHPVCRGTRSRPVADVAPPGRRRFDRRNRLASDRTYPRMKGFSAGVANVSSM